MLTNVGEHLEREDARGSGLGKALGLTVLPTLTGAVPQALRASGVVGVLEPAEARGLALFGTGLGSVAHAFAVLEPGLFAPAAGAGKAFATLTISPETATGLAGAGELAIRPAIAIAATITSLVAAFGAIAGTFAAITLSLGPALFTARLKLIVVAMEAAVARLARTLAGSAAAALAIAETGFAALLVEVAAARAPLAGRLSASIAALEAALSIAGRPRGPFVPAGLSSVVLVIH